MDPQRHRGTCYRAANWQCIGQTQARGRRTPKDVYVYPLQADWRQILQHGPPRSQPKRPPARSGQPRQAAPDGERFVQLWQGLVSTLVRVAGEHDREWVRRQRVLNTLLVMLFVFRLVFAPDRRGYATLLGELWDHCRQLGVALPQPRPVSAAAICKARAKVAAAVFRQAHRALLAQVPRDAPGTLWRGHRVFAVDGSKLNLPRPLEQAGYRRPCDAAYYPQGLLSCLYQLRARLPFDCDLHAHGDERRAALAHLDALAPGDVVVYDRGYYAFQLLHAHCQRGLHAVFRLQRNASSLIRAFILGDRREQHVTVQPSDTARRRCPQAVLRPCRLRLVKYSIGEKTYALGTTLLDRRRYRPADLAKLYHARWGVEEHCKVAKQMLRLEAFRGRSERLVRQEVYANATLVLLARLFANHGEAQWRSAPDGHGRPAVQASLPAQPAHGGAALGGPVRAACQGAAQHRAAHPRGPGKQPPATAPGPLVPAPLAQARQQMEESQGDPSLNHPKIRLGSRNSCSLSKVNASKQQS